MLGVVGLFAGLLVLIVVRAAELAILRGPALAVAAAGQHEKRVELLPRRGTIADRHGETLALSLDVPSVYVRPAHFRGQEDKLPALAATLGVPAASLRAKVGSKQPFVWLKRQALPREAAAVQRLGLKGVGSLTEGRRFYPHHGLAAHVLGFVGVDSQGLAGVERRFDTVIRGRPRYVHADRDAKGREMFMGGVQSAAEHGSRVELTLDATIQAATERALVEGIAAARAVGGAAVVLDPMTGEVLALANAPGFDPNQPGARRDRGWNDRVRNRAITDPYEPGSTLKAMLAAAAIEEKIVAPAERFFCENGRFKVGKWTINDAHRHGWLSFAEVIQYSSNIGVTKVATRLGRERYYRYLQAFGFGNRTGIELPGETAGILRPLERWARVDLAVHSYGQGMSVTPLQLAAAYGALANGGALMRPFLVRRVIGPTGDVAQTNRPMMVRRVISERTARTVTALLRRVVEEKGGTGSRARLEDFAVAGKTGTAQKVNLETGGYSAERIASFVGYVPADRPRAVILVLIDEPDASSYGGVVAAPVFRSIATAVLTRLGVVPVEVPAAVVPARAVTRTPRRPARKAATVAKPKGPATPSFIGLSLREAFARARAEGWEVQMTGTGYVQEQRPPPGTPVAADRRLALFLAPGETVASP
jgi:cell division protein FtsI (penicillin-binding protein 3)